MKRFAVIVNASLDPEYARLNGIAAIAISWIINVEAPTQEEAEQKARDRALNNPHGRICNGAVVPVDPGSIEIMSTIVLPDQRPVGGYL